MVSRAAQAEGDNSCHVRGYCYAKAVPVKALSFETYSYAWEGRMVSSQGSSLRSIMLCNLMRLRWAYESQELPCGSVVAG